MHQLDNLRVNDIGEVAEDHEDGDEADGGGGDQGQEGGDAGRRQSSAMSIISAPSTVTSLAPSPATHWVIVIVNTRGKCHSCHGPGTGARL